MPVRYTQSIYKQYTIFLKDQDAQKAAAAEDMVEELEDGGGFGGGISYNNAKKSSSNSNQNMISIREQQLAAIKANLAKGETQQNAEGRPADDPQTNAIRQAQLAKLKANIMAGREDES